MLAGKVVGLEFEIISKLDSYFLMTVLTADNDGALTVTILLVLAVAGID